TKSKLFIKRCKILEEMLFNIRNLEVKFKMKNEVVKAVNDVSLSVNKGETVGLEGESGSGKSVTSLAFMGLNREALTEGKIEYKRENLLGLSPKIGRAHV